MIKRTNLQALAHHLLEVVRHSHAHCLQLLNARRESAVGGDGRVRQSFISKFRLCYRNKRKQHRMQLHDFSTDCTAPHWTTLYLMASPSHDIRKPIFLRLDAA